MRNIEKCMWCDKPATHYCDATIGFEAVAALRDKAGNVTGLLAGNGRSWTCDAPMCDEHSSKVGHVCGQESGTIDYCPHHMKHTEKPMRELVIFESEVDGKRREVHAEIRRAAMKAKCANTFEASPAPAQLDT